MRRSILWGSAAGLVLLVIAATLGARAGLVAVPFARPAGHAAWNLSRAAAITAYLALTLEIAFGLLLSTGKGDRLLPRARSVEIHRFLSAATLSMVGAHALVLVADRYLRFDLIDVLLPFLAPYRPLAVGLGSAAAYAAIVVHTSFALRSRLGQRTWRRLHYLSFAVFALATTHGLLAGSGAHLGWMRAMYLASGGLVLALTAVRIAGKDRALPRTARLHTE